MRTMALVLFLLALPHAAPASTPSTQAAQQTLEAAILLAGRSVAELPIALAAAPPDEASPGIEAWILPRQDSTFAQIVVYSGSGVFRCASDQHRPDEHCLLKLASAIIHEAWHYRNGVNEAGAYEAQIAFLITHGASAVQITGVRLARQRVLAAQRAIERRRSKKAHEGNSQD